DVPAGPTIFRRSGVNVLAIGSKNGSFFLLDPNTMAVLPNGRRQLLPRAGGNGGFPGDTGANLTGIDSHGSPGENYYGILGTAAVDGGRQRLFVCIGGYSGAIDTPSTPFM